MITIDFETRSTIDLKKAGPWRYAEDPTTDILCLAVKVGDSIPWIWLPDKFKIRLPKDSPFGVLTRGRVKQWAEQAHCEAHNMEFERAIWRHIMHKRYGFPDIALERCYCSAAKAAVTAIPRSLEKACEALHLPIQKDMAGHKLMMKMCKPRKPRKAEKAVNPDWENTLYWHEEADQIKRLCEYCIGDVEAEYTLSQALPELQPSEREVWLLDQAINSRGVHIDKGNVEAIIRALENYEKTLLVGIEELTDGAVKSARQVKALRDWMLDHGVPTENLQKTTVEELLEKSLPVEVKKALEIRQSLSMSSVSKFTAMTKRLNPDGRIRSLFMYHGANTGRFTGKAVQPTNMPRDSYKGKDLEMALRFFSKGQLDQMTVLFDTPTKTASRCVRGSLVSALGKDLIAADYASIEARGNAWLAGEESILEAYRAGLDQYVLAAVDIFGVPYDQITKAQRQIGKVVILSMGYQGGIGAFAAMAKGYNLDLETLPKLVLPGVAQEYLKGPWGAISLAKKYLKKHPGAMSFDAAIACDVIKRKWRENNPAIVRSWKMYNEAAINAIENPGTVFRYRYISYVTKTDKLGNTYLCCRLPSSRILYYFNPRLKKVTPPWAEEGESDKKVRALVYQGVDSMTKRWICKVAYGGLLCENCLAGDTLLLTDGGAKPITEIKCSDRLWDGVQWVNHSGIVSKGKQETGAWLGIRITREHQIYDGSSWKAVIDLDEELTQECLTWARNSVKLSSLNLGEEIPDGLNTDVLAEISKKRITDLYGEGKKFNVPSVVKLICLGESKNKTGTTLSSRTKDSVLCGLKGLTEFYRGAARSIVQRILTMAVEVSTSTRIGKLIDTLFLNMPKLSTAGTTQDLNSTGSITTGDTPLGICVSFPDTRMQITGEQHLSLSTKTSECLTRFFGVNIAKIGQARIPSDGILAEEKPLKRLWKSTGNREEVFDILNAGPRNRFTAVTNSGPVVVHNCTQAMCRDILTGAMTRAEAAGYPVVIHVYDEIVSEIDEEFGSLREFCSILAQNPTWAPGMPIAADGWRGKRYRK